MPRALLFSFLLVSPVWALGFANGIKIGEVTDRSAVLWTRLSADDNARNRVEAWTAKQPNWQVPGQQGEVRFVLTPAADPQAAPIRTPWTAVGPESDYCHQITVKALAPASNYQVRVEGRNLASGLSASLDGSFATAPSVDSESTVHFAVSTCQEFEQRDDPDQGHKIYRSMLALNPQFFIQTGDTVYYDRVEPLAKTIDLARYRWQRMYALPFQRAFHARIPSYWMHDDHDLLKNDCWPGQSYGELTWDQGIQVWNEQIPQSPLPYRSFRWGRHVQIWLPEGRYFRDPNPMPDGPEKTILGKTQWEWLEQSMNASDATFKFYVSATPVVGPDRREKKDNHANEGFSHEGKRLRDFLSRIPGCVVINGDRHWQYHSIDSVTGLQEFCSGPASDSHAGGFLMKMRQPIHRFLRIKGGFLTVRASAAAASVMIHDVDGAVVHEAVIKRPEAVGTP